MTSDLDLQPQTQTQPQRRQFLPIQDLRARLTPPPTPPKAPTKRTSLKDLNLEDELADQYARAKSLLETAEYDESIPLNQKAQALNSITSVLAHIVKSQTDLHSAERVKAIESSIITALKKAPKDIQDAFFEEYGLALLEATK